MSGSPATQILIAWAASFAPAEITLAGKCQLVSRLLSTKRIRLPHTGLRQAVKDYGYEGRGDDADP